MKNKKLEANLSMAVSKIFSGLNMNALKYLLPLWMSPLTGATLRCTFAAVAFWVIGWFMPPEKSSTKDKWLLFLLGAFGLYGFMFLYLAGLSKTTPVSSSIFTSLQPIWVFLIMIFFYKEKATWKKILGISIGLIGALVCILTQQSDDLASDAFMGNMLCLLSSVVYAVYLILSQRILSSIGAMTMLRYTFSGAAVSAIIVTFITGFDAPVFSMPFHWTPFLILMFVLLLTKVIKVEHVKETGEFLIEIMPLMFIPAGVGLITSWSQLQPFLVPLLVITVVSTFVVMIVTGKVTDFLISKKEGKK